MGRLDPSPRAATIGRSDLAKGSSMPIVNILEAKAKLSRLVATVESGAETEIVIARNGRPAARLVPIAATPAGRRIGVAKGKFTLPDPDIAFDATIEKLFRGGWR